MASSTDINTIQKISEIKSGGTIWKPITFQVLYKYPVNTKGNEIEKSSPFKFIIGDSTAQIILLCLNNKNVNKACEKIKLNSYYTIAAGGVSARNVNTKYPQILTHQFELWIQNTDKIDEEDNCSFDAKGPLSFNFTSLNKLSLTTNGRGSDVIAKVNWKSPEKQAKAGSRSKFKEIRLEDNSRKGKNKALLCKLWGDHRKFVTKKGVTVIIHNANIVPEDNDLVINVQEKSAMFVISTDDGSWMLSETQKNENQSFLVIPVSQRGSLDNIENGQDSDSDSGQNLIHPSVSSPISPKRCKTENQSPTQSPSNKKLKNTGTPSPKKDLPITMNISEAKKLMAGKRQIPLKFELKSVFISRCTLRRYLGCKSCTKALTIADGKYICSGVKCKYENKEREPEKKIFFLLKNITLTDGPDSEFLDQIICFNKPIEEFLEKSAGEFETDTDADSVFRSQITNRYVDVIINAERKGPPGPNLCKSPWKFVIEKLTLGIVNIISNQESEQELSVHTDSVIDERIEDSINRISQEIAARAKLDINVISSSGWIDNNEDQYRMKSNPRGIAIHINITKNRNGAEEDIRIFKTIFTQLNYEVMEIIDVTSNELNMKIEECHAAFNNPNKNYDSLVLFISGHGLSNNILLCDTVIVNIWAEIIYKFDDSNFPNFRGKPKIVVINACQNFGTTDHIPLMCPSNMPSSDPNHADFLVFVANSPGFKSYRDPVAGTHFMRTLATVIMNHAHNMEIKRLFSMVAKIMVKPVENEVSSGTQIIKPHLPEIRDFLFSKEFYFNPGLFGTSTD